MNHAKIALTALVLASMHGFASVAHSADVTAENPWSGPYVGLQGSYLLGSGSYDICENKMQKSCMAEAYPELRANPSSKGSGLGDQEIDGARAGAFVGYNYLVNDFMLGVEADANWNFAEASPDGAVVGDGQGTYSLNYDMSLRARLGFMIHDRALFFVTGGPSWMSSSFDWPSCDNSAPAGTDCGGDSPLTLGYQLGAGVEVAMTDSVFVKLEYLHGRYEDLEVNMVEDAEMDINYNQDLTVNILQAGVGLRF